VANRPIDRPTDLLPTYQALLEAESPLSLADFAAVVYDRANATADGELREKQEAQFCSIAGLHSATVHVVASASVSAALRAEGGLLHHVAEGLPAAVFFKQIGNWKVDTDSTALETPVLVSNVTTGDGQERTACLLSGNHSVVTTR
jgi:hypothetical protein